MRYLFLVSVIPMFFMSESALAYASQIYGHGIAPGADNCGYGPQPASAMYDKDYEYREIQNELKEAQKELQAYSRERDRLKRRIRDYKKDSDRYLKPYAASQVVDHIENGNSELDYRGGDYSVISPACQGSNPHGLSGEFCVNEGACLMNGAPTVSEKASMGCVENGAGGYTGVRDEWTNKYIKNMRDGFVNDAICSTTPALPKINQQRCKNWINNFSKDAADFRTAQNEIENLKERIKDLKRDLSDRRRDIKEEIEDGTFVASEEETEAKDCVNCSWASRHSDTIRLVAGIGLPILGAYMGYRGARSISEQNARLGWPTSPYIASNMAYPFIMQGIYGGILGGLGAGGFGCAGGYYGGAMGPFGMGGVGGLFGAGIYGGMGGAFGYPGYLYGSPWGMGPYMPGMGPWGIPGPFMGGGFPGGGMMIGGAIGGMMGGYPFGGMMGGPAGGMMGGYPFGGMMGGYPVGGMMGGYPVGGMMGGYPVGGMIGGAIGGMMGGYPFGGMMGGALGGMQMQQLYMQQYMQQMQQHMQYQMQASQEYMQKEQMVGRLTQELMRIQLQIYEISSGSLYGGSLPYSVLPIQGGTGGVGGGTSPTGGSGSVILGR